MNADNVTALVNEYALEKDAYAAFASAVENLLVILLQTDDFRYQISARAKVPESLRRKLMEGRFRRINTLKEVQDLAACRVLFYIESDIERFARKLYDEFKIVSRDDRYSVDDYNAVHIVVKLKENRTALPEYAQFADMICEIQLSTILYHAWSEIAHDIIYKPPLGLREFDKPGYASIKKRFKTVMEDYIKQASFALEFIHWQFAKIKQGKQVFDADFLLMVKESKSLDEIHENLKLLAEYVNEFGDKTPKELGIISIIRTVLEKSKGLQAEPVRTAIGEIGGSTFGDVANACIEILETLRYWHPKEMFDLVLPLTRADDSVSNYHPGRAGGFNL
jgi:ppGpp synthetase/RelA/SpoT-type nucleotidyltranferase